MGNVERCRHRKQVKNTSKKAIWEAVLDADFNVRYWGHLSRRYSVRDNYTKIFLATMSSSTVASWGIWNEVNILWKILFSISSVTAIVFPFLNLQKKIGEMSNLRGKWSRISRAYENLWENLLLGQTSTDVFNEYRRIRNEMEGEEDNTILDLPHDKKLIQRCRDEV